MAKILKIMAKILKIMAKILFTTSYNSQLFNNFAPTINIFF